MLFQFFLNVPTFVCRNAFLNLPPLLSVLLILFISSKCFHSSIFLTRFYNWFLAWRAVGASHLGAVLSSNRLASFDSSTSARFDLLGLFTFAAALLGHQCFASTLFLIRLDTGIHHALIKESRGRNRGGRRRKLEINDDCTI